MVDEQQIKRDLNKQRIESLRATSSGTLNNIINNRDGKRTDLEKGEQFKQGSKELSKGLRQLASGNEVVAMKTIAKAAKDIAKSGAVTDTAKSVFTGQMGVMWYFMLAVAVAKDGVDIMALELFWWLDWMIDLCVGGLLWVYLAMHGSNRVKLLRFIVPPLEIIPFFGIIPWWTIATIFAGMKKTEKKKMKEMSY